MLKHRAGVENKPADALSRLTLVVSSITGSAKRFEHIRQEYSACPNFGPIHQALTSDPPVPHAMAIFFGTIACASPGHHYEIS